jgi:hypothetical protein
VGPQEPPLRCVSLLMGTPRRAVPPMDYRHKPPPGGGQFWRPIGGQYSTPIDSHLTLKSASLLLISLGGPSGDAEFARLPAGGSRIRTLGPIAGDLVRVACTQVPSAGGGALRRLAADPGVTLKSARNSRPGARIFAHPRSSAGFSQTSPRATGLRSKECRPGLPQRDNPSQLASNRCDPSDCLQPEATQYPRAGSCRRHGFWPVAALVNRKRGYAVAYRKEKY